MEEKRRDSTGTPPPSSVTAEALPPEPTSRRRGGGQKRKSTSLISGAGSSNPTSSKRQTREKPPAVIFPPIHMNGPLTRARLQPSSSLTQAEVQSVVKSEVEAQEAAAMAEEMIRVSENWEALEAEIEAEYELIKTRDSNIHVVPVHAGWFAWNKIHPLEKRMLPSFFSGKSDKRNPEMYMEIRNWIMKKFHLDPDVNFEQKHLAELTVGELDARQEVMEFLDYWGLINYHPFPQNESGAMNVESDAGETQKRELLVEKLYKFDTVQSWSPLVPRMDSARPATSSGLFSESVIADELVKSEGPSVEYHCNSCSADCSRKRYHCQKQADFDLCAECFNNEEFGSNMSPSDFILMEPAETGGASGGNWTDQETLLLLEAIELFRDNWTEIAEHVATKTKAQCILHFVEMPIEDTFFNHDKEDVIAPKHNGLPVSSSIEDCPAKEDQDGNTASKDVPEKQESVSDNQASSSLVEISKAAEVNDSYRSNEVTDSFALKALKEAFEAVGSLPSPGERLSFAEASNPVMTLAVYLVRLVEPSIATASAHSLLKSLSSYNSSSHLAARHCFRLEDPPDDEKKIGDSEGAPTGKNDLEAKRGEDEHGQEQNGDTCNPVIDKTSPQDDKNEESEHEDSKNPACEDQRPEVSSNNCDEISDGVKEPDGMAADDPQTTSTSDPSTTDIPKEQTIKVLEEEVSPSHSEPQTNIVRELENGALAVEPSQLEEPLKVEEMVSNTEEKLTEPLTVSNSSAEKKGDKGDVKGKECDTEKKETRAFKNDLEVDKLKRVAVSALSAAAVKAKLLADHEENQIRQLATFLIDKQLQKLESKLAFFSDMETVAMRVKEQLDRSKQKLFHERAQIIATRFGMSASARPNSQFAPPNRAATASAPSNQGPRPVMVMNSLRPPIARPGMAPNPAPSNFAPAAPPGTSVQPSYSVGSGTK